MSKLSSKTRAGLKDSDFAGPGRSFPIEDADHARAAILDAPNAEAHGSITASERESIDRKARAKLGENETHGAAADSEYSSMVADNKKRAKMDKHPTRVAIRKAADCVAGKYK